MKELKLNIGPLYVRAEHLQDVSCYNENYYKIESVGDSCCIHHPFNIIQEVCHEDYDYYEYSFGHFENGEHGGEFIEAFSWTSEYGAGSIFSKF